MLRADEAADDVQPLCLQVALTKRITSRAKLEEVGCSLVASNTEKLFEVGLDEHMVHPCSLLCPVLHAMQSQLSRRERRLSHDVKEPTRSLSVGKSARYARPQAKHPAHRMIRLADL